LYNVSEGEKGFEITSKGQHCGKDFLSTYISGTHFTAKELYEFEDGKQMTARALWDLDMTVLKSLKKTIVLVFKF
jgi:hypothetical protein